jgi:hypothetical protein
MKQRELTTFGIQAHQVEIFSTVNACYRLRRRKRLREAAFGNRMTTKRVDVNVGLSTYGFAGTQASDVVLGNHHMHWKKASSADLPGRRERARTRLSCYRILEQGVESQAKQRLTGGRENLRV